MEENIGLLQKEFQVHLESLNRDKTLVYSMKLLSEGRVSIRELYEEIISPSLNSIVVNRENEDESIWKEHLMTNIVRTVIECAYPYVLKEREKYSEENKPRRVMVLCPEEEYHEIGSRMGADFFTIINCEVFFIGCNTPKENFIAAYNALKPDIIAISITNYLNLVSLKKIVAEIKDQIGSQVMVVLSGSAFKHTLKKAEDFAADALVNTFSEIAALRRNNL